MITRTIFICLLAIHCSTASTDEDVDLTEMDEPPQKDKSNEDDSVPSANSTVTKETNAKQNSNEAVDSDEEELIIDSSMPVNSMTKTVGVIAVQENLSPIHLASLDADTAVDSKAPQSGLNTSSQPKADDDAEHSEDQLHDTGSKQAQKSSESTDSEKNSIKPKEKVAEAKMTASARGTELVALSLTVSFGVISVFLL